MATVLGEHLPSKSVKGCWLELCGASLSEAVDERASTSYAMMVAIKVASESQIAFAVEAVAASHIRDAAQQLKRWKGRIFLPLLYGVGFGSVVDDSADPEVVQKPAMLVMQLADDTLQDKKFQGEAIVLVAWALASTLSLLNASGFIHGDLKPSNVLWQSFSDAQSHNHADPSLDGWPLLTDFGSAQAFNTMARCVDTPLDISDRIHTHGWTRAYAAPEVRDCGGQWQTIRSDMFSWARTIQTISKHRKLPRTLHELTEACLSWDPEKRPSSFAEIAGALENPACLSWGLRLWQQQQTAFESSAHAQQHSGSLRKQGLQVLLSHRSQFSADRRAETDALQLLANQHLQIGNAKDAVWFFQEGLKVDPGMTVNPFMLESLGRAYGDLGDATKMRDLLELALKIFEACFGEDHHEVAITLTSLGNAHGDLGDATKKRDLLERALKIKEAYFGEDHKEVAITLTSLGNAYGYLGDAPKHRALLERALKIFEAYFGEDSHEVAGTLVNLGNAYGYLGDATKMRDLLERALKIEEAYFGEDHKEVAITLTNLGNAYGDLGDAAKKRDLLERALKIFEAYFGEDHKEVAITLTNLGERLWRSWRCS